MGQDAGIGRQVRGYLYRTALELMPASLALALQFRRTQGRWPNLKRPRSFNEKLQWRKLHDRNPLLPFLIDKIAVKELLAGHAGVDEWLIPTLWSGSRVSTEILAGIAPPYVIKPNHASGRILFNRGDFPDLAALAARANAMVAKPHPRFLQEWPYGQIGPRLLIEPFIGADLAVPEDYKLYVFHGRVRFIQVDTDRERSHRRALYSREWRRMPFQYRINQRAIPMPRPSQLERMVAFAERIATDLALDFIRVDLYEVGGRTWVGELTPFPSSGFAKFDPPSADFEIGRFWRLPHHVQPVVRPHPVRVLAAVPPEGSDGDARMRLHAGLRRRV